jgi:hypothetical protein
MRGKFAGHVCFPTTFLSPIHFFLDLSRPGAI